MSDEKEIANLAAPDEPGAEFVQDRIDPNIRALIELEQARLRANNRRYEVAEKAIDADDAQDRRQYEYHMTKLANDAEEKRVRFRFGRVVITVIGIAIILIEATLFTLAFWGRPEQSAFARQFLVYGFVALGGGVFFSLSTASSGNSSIRDLPQIAVSCAQTLPAKLYTIISRRGRDQQCNCSGCHA